MFAVIFEVVPKKDHWDDYLALAKQLRPKLEAIDGFIDNERFGSKKTEGLLLSLSIWRDEKSVVRWRTQGEHHGVQKQGRNVVFEDYHLRVGEIMSDSAPPEGVKVMSERADETEIGESKICTLTEVSLSSLPEAEQVVRQLPLDPRAEGLSDYELFESITNPGKLLVAGSWRDHTLAVAWKPRPFEGARDVRHRQVRVIRDYGMFDRREAPQFYPNVPHSARKVEPHVRYG
jgi:heme-degrading monooxygenase HmoA